MGLWVRGLEIQAKTRDALTVRHLLVECVLISVFPKQVMDINMCAHLYTCLRYTGRWRFAKRHDKNEGNITGRDICAHSWEEDNCDNGDDRQINNFTHTWVEDRQSRNSNK